MKTCTRCAETKPLDSFAIDSRRPNGRHPWCKECMRLYVRSMRNQPGGREKGRATNRARSIALEELARRHPNEFDSLLTSARVAEGLSPIPYSRAPV